MGFGAGRSGVGRRMDLGLGGAVAVVIQVVVGLRCSRAWKGLG